MMHDGITISLWAQGNSGVNFHIIFVNKDSIETCKTSSLMKHSMHVAYLALVLKKIYSQTDQSNLNKL